MKVGKIKVAREISINTNVHQEINPSPNGWGSRCPLWAGCGVRGAGLQLGGQAVTREEAAPSMTRQALLLCKGPYACTPDGLSKVWTSGLTGICFPNYTHQVLAIIKAGVTKTAQGVRRMSNSCVRLFPHFPVIYNVQHSARRALHSQGKDPDSEILGLAGPRIPRRSINKLQRP